jgi:hypothetical protein
VDELLAAASAALGDRLSGPAVLAGSGRSTVLRCRDSSGGPAIVKSWPLTEAGARSFAAEASGLAFTSAAGVGPQLLAAFGALPARAAAAGLAVPGGLGADLAEVATVLEPCPHRVFSPGGPVPGQQPADPVRLPVHRLRERRVPLRAARRGLHPDAVQHVLVRVPAAGQAGPGGGGRLPVRGDAAAPGPGSSAGPARATGR